MLLNDTELEARLNSTDNLINRLRRSAPAKTELVNPSRSGGIETDRELSSFLSVLNGNHHKPSRSQDYEIPSLPPNSSDLIENLEDKIKTAQVNHKALSVLDESLDLLRVKLDEVQNAKDLSRIATDMEKILNGSRISERESNRSSSGAGVIIYKPIMVNENHYESLAVNE